MKNLKALRVKAGLLPGDLAKLIGLSESSVAKYERLSLNRRNPTMRTILIFMQALNCTFEEFSSMNNLDLFALICFVLAAILSIKGWK